MRIFCTLANLRMATRQQEGIGVADFGLDNAKVAGGIEQARIPAFPVRQLGLDFVAKSHGRNVTECPWQDNDLALVLDHAQRIKGDNEHQGSRYDELQRRQAIG